MTSRSKWILAAVLAASACHAPMVRRAPFRARPDSIAAGDLRGPFQGRVLDGDTGRAVSGALVYATWTFISGTGLTAPAGWREYMGSTDAGGFYAVPRLDQVPSDGSTRLADFRLVIYKKGFVAYRSDARFADLGARTDFTQQRNEVKLDRWHSDYSHVKHLRYVGGGAALAELTAWEVPEAARELSGKPSEQMATPGEIPIAPPEAPHIHAENLLKPEDVSSVTGFKGTFDVRELGDEPSSAEYDSVHLQAKGQDESYDIALRLWKLSPEEAQAHYDKMKGDLPGVTEANEIGDKSLRASTKTGDILGIGFLDAKRGVVVLLQCGTSQCRTHDMVLAIARKVKERAEAEFPLGGGTP